MFSAVGAYEDGSWLTQSGFCCLSLIFPGAWHILQLSDCSSSYWKLRIEWSGRVSHFFSPLLMRTGSWFWPWVAPPGPLWIGSWFPGQIFLVSYLWNPQPNTDYNQHFSICRMKLMVTSGLMDLGPVLMPHQLDWLITSLMTWCWAGLAHKLLQERPSCIFSTPKHWKILVDWLKEWVAGRKPASYVQGACLVVFRFHPLKARLSGWGPCSLHKVENLRGTLYNLIRIQALFFDQLREKIPTVRHNPRFQEAFHSDVWTPVHRKAYVPPVDGRQYACWGSRWYN